MILEFVDLTQFDSVVVEAMQAFAAATDSDGSFEAFEAAQATFYSAIGDHPQCLDAEMALGF